MKKLLVATILLVLAALTETPDDYILGGSSDKGQVSAYLSVWENPNADEVRYNEEQFFEEPVIEINSGGLKSMDALPDSGVAI